MDYTSRFYSRPSYAGSGVIFSGARRQRGGSILGALKSLVLPVMAKVGPKIARSVGNIAKRHLFGLATDVLTDKIRGKNLKESLKTHGKTRLLQGASQGLNSLSNMVNVTKPTRRAPPKKKPRSWRIRGSGIKKRKSATTRKRKASCKRKVSRKRYASRKRTPPAKKAKTNF